jgi:hypothetical protein
VSRIQLKDALYVMPTTTNCLARRMTKEKIIMPPFDFPASEPYVFTGV